MLCQSRACPTPLLQPAVAVAKEPVGAVALGCGCGDRRGCWRGWLVTLGLGTHWHDDADAVSLSPPQLSGADPECSCDEGDETSRKKRSRNL